MQTLNALLDRYMGEILNRGDFTNAGDILGARFVFYGPGNALGMDSAAFARYLKEMRAAFSQKEFTELERIVSGDRAAVRFRMTGIQDGPYRGLPPLGGAIDVEGCDLVRVSEGKIAEVRAYFDLMAVMGRLLIPGPLRVFGQFMEQVWSR
jgi:predicted ester cyclase